MTLPISGSYSPPYDLTHLRMSLPASGSYSPPYDLSHLCMSLPASGSYSPPYDLPNSGSYSPPYDLTHLCMSFLNCVVIMNLLTSVWPDSPPYDRTLPWAAHLPPPHSSHRCCRWIWSAHSRAKVKGPSTEIINPRHPKSLLNHNGADALSREPTYCRTKGLELKCRQSCLPQFLGRCH